MTTTKKAQRATKGKAKAEAGDRARAIIADAKGYSRETRRALRRALETHDGYIAELVRRAEAGEPVIPPPDHAPGLVIPADVEAEAFKAQAIAYAQSAFEAALGHFETYHAEPFTLNEEPGQS
jgi:hypothetical protein